MGGIDSRAETDGDGCDDAVSDSVIREEKVFDCVAIDTSADDDMDCTLDAVVCEETLGDAETRAERESVGDTDELEDSLGLELAVLDASAEVDDVGDASAERDSAGDFDSDEKTDGDGEVDDDVVSTLVGLEETLELTEPVGEAVRRTVLDGNGERDDEADIDGDAVEDDVFNEALALGDPLAAAVLRADDVPVAMIDPVLSLEDVDFHDSDAVIDRVDLGEEDTDTDGETVGDGFSELDTDELLTREIEGSADPDARSVARGDALRSTVADGDGESVTSSEDENPVDCDALEDGLWGAEGDTTMLKDTQADAEEESLFSARELEARGDRVSF